MDLSLPPRTRFIVIPHLFRQLRIAPLILLLTMVPALARAAATAQGVALNASASCSNADLDLTLTTAGAIRELGQSTNLAGATLDLFEEPTVPLANFSGTYVGYHISIAPSQPAGTLIGSYAYVGTTLQQPSPLPATTAEFFVYFNCSTEQVLLSCFGPYGTCPQTALQAQAQLALGNSIPALNPWGLALAALVLAGSGLAALRRRR
jgi:hypothetical protein